MVISLDFNSFYGCTLWEANSLPLKMAIEIVSLSDKHGDFP